MNIEKRTVYLAGKITGDENYKNKFAEAATMLENADYIVINSALLPSEGFSYDSYTRMSSAMLDECDAVCFLSDWIESWDAMYEFGRAVSLGKHIFRFEEFLGFTRILET